MSASLNHTSLIFRKVNRFAENLSRRLDSFLKRPYIHHGFRLALLLVMAYLCLVLTPGRGIPEPFVGIEKGRVADQDVLAPFDFAVYKSQEELERERNEAAESVLPVVEFDPQVRDSVLGDLLTFFDKIDRLTREQRFSKEIISWKTYAGSSQEQRAAYKISPLILGSLYSIDSLLSLSDEEIVYLFDRGRREQMRTRLKDYLVSRLRTGLISAGSLEKIKGPVVMLRREDKEELVQKIEINTVNQALEESLLIELDSSYPEISKGLFLQLLTRYLRPNIIYDEAETGRLRNFAADQVKPTRDQLVLKGEKIIGRGERVTPEMMESLQSLKLQIDLQRAGMGQSIRFRHDAGLYLIYFLLLFATGIFLLLYRQDVYDEYSKLLIMAISWLLVILFSSLVLSRPEIPSYLIPVAIASMLIAYLIDCEVAVLSTFPLAIVLGVQANFSLYILLLALIGGTAGAISVRRITTRHSQYISILYLLGAYIIGVAAIDFGFRGEHFPTVLKGWGWSSLNAFISTLVTVGLLPLFEYLFKITSNYTLLELSDLNRPLLKRLAIEAPGTYHHSIIMSNLAEAAAAGIGANPVYARVAALYHDIGKLKKPDYFIENQGGKPNPHDKLSPRMSSLIIANHVKEGVDLAQQAGLPKCVIDVIREHHGDASISFFYSKEKKLNPDTTLDERDFLYPGPKPRNKEAAIIMLADSVESASRVLSDPTTSRIKGLIRQLIEKKLREGQMDEAELTLKDLTRIGDEFLPILIGVHHQRIEYPAQAAEKETNARTNKNRNKSVPGNNSAHDQNAL